MAVYVDNARIPFKGMNMSHMVADTLDELHSMADKLGLKRSWFQDGKTSMPHYDLSVSKREEAISLGAVAVPFTEMVTIIRKHRESKNASTF